MLFQFGKKDNKNIQNQTISRWRQLSLDRSSDKSSRVQKEAKEAGQGVLTDENFEITASESVACVTNTGNWQVGQFDAGAGEYVRVIENGRGSSKAVSSNDGQELSKDDQVDFEDLAQEEVCVIKPQSAISSDVNASLQSCSGDTQKESVAFGVVTDTAKKDINHNVNYKGSFVSQPQYSQQNVQPSVQRSTRPSYTAASSVSSSSASNSGVTRRGVSSSSAYQQPQYSQPSALRSQSDLRNNSASESSKRQQPKSSGVGQAQQQTAHGYNEADVKTALGYGTLIDGKFSFDAPVRIDGSLSGEVRSSSLLIVGEQASINAKVEVGSLVVFGDVTGEIRVRDLVEVKSGGRLRADIIADRIIIERGGIFNGQYRMS